MRARRGVGSASIQTFSRRHIGFATTTKPDQKVTGSPSASLAALRAVHERKVMARRPSLTRVRVSAPPSAMA
jgi:hypothetical protein